MGLMFHVSINAEVFRRRAEFEFTCKAQLSHIGLYNVER
jgi:hypothetical protein